MDDKDIGRKMKGMVFLLIASPFPGQSWAHWPGREGRKGYGGFSSTGQRRPVWGLPFTSTRVQTSPLCKHNSGRNEDVLFLLLRVLKLRATLVAQLSGEPGLRGFSPVTLALPIVLHVCSSAFRAACQGSVAWPQHNSVGSLEYLSVP